MHMVTMMIWIMDRKKKSSLLRLMNIMDRLMVFVVKRDRRESLLSLSLECWWKGHLGLKDQQVSPDPQVLLVHQAVLETLEIEVFQVGLVSLVLMVCQDPQELS